MVGLTSFLVVACALAINVQGLAPGACTPAQIGSQSAFPHKLEPAVLAPGIADWEIEIPEIPQCPNSAVGAAAVTCDGDVAPTVTFVSKNMLYVHRNGNLAGYAGVVVTVYCPYYVNGAAPTNSHNKLPQSLVLNQY